MAHRHIIITSNVFLDTEVFVEANFSYNSSRLRAVAEHASSGRIRVFLTDLTIREVKANIQEAVERATSKRPEPILRNSSMPQVKAFLEGIDATKVTNDLFNQFDAFIKGAQFYQSRPISLPQC